MDVSFSPLASFPLLLQVMHKKQKMEGVCRLPPAAAAYCCMGGVKRLTE
jgi:hypothetical protein